MERAGKSLGKLSEDISPLELARSAWPAAVGKRIAQHAVVINLVRDRLVVEVDDAVWQKQLFHLRFQILPKVREMLGEGVVADLEFRVAGPRRPPQAAAQLRETLLANDESDQIEDPVLRRVYRQAKRKASA